MNCYMYLLVSRIVDADPMVRKGQMILDLDGWHVAREALTCDWL